MLEPETITELKAIYHPGKDKPADFLLRNPFNQKPIDKLAEDYVRFIAEHSLPKALTLEELQGETTTDSTLQAVKEAVQTGQWHKALKQPGIDTQVLKTNKSCSRELAVLEDEGGFVIRKGNVLAILLSLQKQVVQLAHEEHQGIVKTKQLLRQKVWLPGGTVS